MANGHPIDAGRLAGYRYDGVSLGLPRWIERLSWKKFFKSFDQLDGSDTVYGWNTRAEDNALSDPWKPILKRERPVEFGQFHVCQATCTSTPPTLQQALLIDYSQGGRGGNGILNGLRDPLVALKKDCVQYLLGWSYLKIGTFRLGTPSYFLLRRGESLKSMQRSL